MPANTGIFWLDGWPRVAYAGHDVTWAVIYFGIALMWLGIAAFTFYWQTHPECLFAGGPDAR